MPTEHSLSQAELKLMEIIWANNPILSAELIKIAGQEFGWKRTTVYTLLKRIGAKGILKNDNALVVALISREEFFAKQSHNFVADTFGGSLPMFITSFISGKKLSQQQAAELRQLIDEHERAGDDE